MRRIFPRPSSLSEGALRHPKTVFTSSTLASLLLLRAMNLRSSCTVLIFHKPIQPLDSARALPSVLIAGKVSRGTSELAESRSFDVDVMQYGIMAQQLARMRCYYPPAHPRLDRTPVPSAEKYVIVQGSITELDHKRCIVCVHDITPGPSTNVVENRRHRDATAPTQLKSFNWNGKGKKSKRASHTDSDVESESNHQKKGKKRQVISQHEAMEDAGPSTKTV